MRGSHILIGRISLSLSTHTHTHTHTQTKVQVELLKANSRKAIEGGQSGIHPADLACCSRSFLVSDWDYSRERQWEGGESGCITSFSSHWTKLPTIIYFWDWHSSQAKSQVGHVCRHFWLLQLRGRCYWHLLGRSQGCCSTCFNTQVGTHNKELPGPKYQ